MMTHRERQALLADYIKMERWEREISQDKTFRADSRKFAGERADRYLAIIAELRAAD